MAFLRLPTISLPHKKTSADIPPKRIPVPCQVCIPMSMHIGTPASPIVKKGDKVKKGQLIGRAQGKISAPVHASVSGTVKDICVLPTVNNQTMLAVVIESDGRETQSEDIRPPKINSKEDLIKAVAESGLVGLGGAAFPTAVKLEAEPDTVIINGAECEPYITSDTRTIIDCPDDLARGIFLIQNHIKPKRIIIAVEDNKKSAIETLKSTDIGNGEIMVLQSVYPQGSEKVLVYNVTGKIIPEGKLPAHVGVTVLNVTTAAFMGKYERTGMPLTEKCVTVDGSAVKNNGNYIIPIGTSVRDVIQSIGGYKSEAKKIILGGPMMGVAIPTDEYPVMKSTNALLFLDEAESKIPPETPCINCGRCIQRCPVRLDPPGFGRAYEKKDCAVLEALKVNLCMECGVCAYVCPAKRHLVQRNRLAKGMLREYKEKAKNE